MKIKYFPVLIQREVDEIMETTKLSELSTKLLEVNNEVIVAMDDMLTLLEIAKKYHPTEYSKIITLGSRLSKIASKLTDLADLLIIKEES